ncbi:hypothetical protein DSUL_20318 [Desulfovibrionales bacterium]
MSLDQIPAHIVRIFKDMLENLPKVPTYLQAQVWGAVITENAKNH